MQRIESVNPESAEGRVRELFDSVEQALGTIPNAVRVMANSPPVLDSFLAFTAAMAPVGIGEKLHTQLKLTTSASNDCNYCTSMLCSVGPSAGLSPDDILAARGGTSEDAHTAAALEFAQAVLESRGRVSDAQLASVRNAGFGDAEIVEIVASVVLGCFTNFLNNVSDTALDFPQAQPAEACSVN